jgi:tetratricopeptide (TPR) repeat protein
MSLLSDNWCLEKKRASDWMHQGIDLLNENSAISLKQAVRCFDEAIALRRTLPLAGHPRHRYDLAAGWMNRADALARMEGEGQRDESLKSYDEALRLLQDLPLEEDTLYPRRLAIAWINRGSVRQKDKMVTAGADALRCFREAITVLEDAPALAIVDRDRLRAGALTNLAGALLDCPESSAAEARQAAKDALGLIKKEEGSEVIAAETALKVRHVLCRAVAAESVDGKSIPPELIAEATDAVDEGLALARHWEHRGEKRFRVLAEDLFRFGCRIYQTCRPHFLTEFILGNLDVEKTGGVPAPNQEMHEAALAALWSALKEIQRGGFESLATPRFGQLLENLRELRVTEERLDQLRRVSSSTLAE